MKCLAISSVVALIGLGAIAPDATAQMRQPYNSPMRQSQGYSGSNLSVPTIDEVNPFELTYMAYNGGLDDYGIPAAHYLIHDYRLGYIDGEDIVQTAVQNNIVSSEALDDPLYVRQVEDFLRSLENRG